ncbi:MAG: FAD:protein FMN transferase [Treponema sp.]
MAIKRIFYCCILCSICATSCKTEQKSYSRTVLLLGTVCTIQLFSDITAEKAAAVLQRCVDRITVLDQQLSANSEQSMLAEINTRAEISAVPVPADIYPLFERSIFFAQLTQGAFNPAIGSVVKLWNIGFDTAQVPSTEDIHKALQLTDYTEIKLSEGTAFLKKKGMKLDLGAIAKGFAADEVVTILKTEDITSALIDIGGTITAVGTKQTQQPWTIGIRDPRQQQGNAVIAIQATDKSISTSGVYERFFIQDGIRYHHIIDPKTGKPVESKLLSVSIITDSATDADALSTACFVLGYEASLQILNAFSHTEALFIFDDNTLQATAGLINKLRILNPDFRLARQKN